MIKTRLDIDFVRALFPAFSENTLKGRAFFENAGGSYACRHVAWRLSRFYRERKVQPYAPYEASLAAGAEMDQARESLAGMLGVRTHEVSFGPSTTQNVYVLANAFREHLKPGQAIVVTNQDHEANSGAWRKLAASGIEVREWQIDPGTGRLHTEDLSALLDEHVKLVCFPHCSNIIGEINPVAQIVQMAKSVGAATCVDGVSYAPHGFPNVQKLGADIYMFSAYKTYGPHQGVMVVREALGFELPNQAHHFNGDVLYKRFTPAGPDHAQIAACAGMADYVDAVYDHHFKAGRNRSERAACVNDMIRDHEHDLMHPLLDYLTQKNTVRVLGPQTPSRRAPTIALELQEPGEDVAERLVRHKIMAGGGDFYARRPLEAMGIDPVKGVLRLSFVHYNNLAEVEHLIRALDQEL